VFVSSGLGGMSGAQAKAGVICGAIAVVAEVNPAALEKRHKQGWVMEVATTLRECIDRIKSAKKEKKPLSLAYKGNIVDLWESLAVEEEMLVELGSDQTSLHNPFHGGYYPVELSFDQANEMMVKDPPKFKELVQASLRRHVAAINKLAARGMKFWDYGNSFLLEASRASADILDEKKSFRYPSYVQDIMGDIFSLGFGPFRWVCTSGLPEDLSLTDKIAAEIIEQVSKDAAPKSKKQFDDNLLWIKQAEGHQLVVGSQARILYSDAKGRLSIALAFNKAVSEGKLKGPVVISRDHHDVSGADSPYRETSNIYDGSSFCADMAVQNFVGDSFRGATWVALHNGGGTGWGEAINGGFGLVLDGSKDTDKKTSSMLKWDVLNGVSRRSWAKNINAEETIQLEMQENAKLKVTLPIHADSLLIDQAYTSL